MQQVYRIPYLQVVDDDGVVDAVAAEELGHRAQTGARDSDVHREVGGDGVEPPVQLRTDRTGSTLHTAMCH